MRRLALLLLLPPVLLAMLGAWAIRGEYVRTGAELREDAQDWATLAVAKLDGIEESVTVEVPFLNRQADEPSLLATDFARARVAELSEAKEELANLREDPGLAAARSATGLPLEPLVIRAQLEFAEEHEKGQLAEELRAAIERHPSALSFRLMQDAAESLPEPLVADSLASAKAVERIVERLAIDAGGWVEGETRSDWPRNGDRAVFLADRVSVTPIDRVRNTVDARLRDLGGRLPPFLGLAVSWQGNEILPSNGEALAQKAEGAFALSVSLSDADAFAAELRRRTAWIAGVVACALVVVSFGSWTAWRAFKRQRTLAALQSDFIASVSHELRTPVTSIGVLAERLESGELDESPEKISEYHRFIGREGRRLSALVENVLDFSRIEQGRKAYEFEHADLPRLVRETTELVRPYAEERGLSLREEITLSEASPSPEVDSMALRQALVNLLDNAIKFTPKGGTVTVGLAQGKQSRDSIRLWITDTGPGIPSKEDAKIFERFYRADNGLRRETTGAGIGLSLVKHIVDAHRGKITVISELKKGTTFTVELSGGSDDD